MLDDVRRFRTENQHININTYVFKNQDQNVFVFSVSRPIRSQSFKSQSFKGEHSFIQSPGFLMA